ncbi:metallophosphoesterase family protein [Roseobacter ponti]|uniref:Metallophosphoesterase n=1 Tax=Roseobacter ponti TaxID=1891787 RepID=A0A858SRL9_9RHOB|nr:metallophosphoesterase [Roseobacter ponti]QJF50323.1 metallophosphoesterase [Roseobacter ponti]
MTAIRTALIAALLFLFSIVPALADGLRVAVISDLNGSYGSVVYNPRVSAAVERIIALEPDLVLLTGDMVAGQRRPHLSEAEVRAMWRAFHGVVSVPLARAGIPLAVTPGNHDASGYSGFEQERRIYADEWRNRVPEVQFVPGGAYPFHYAFNMAGVQFISLDATVVGSLDPAQRAWLGALGTDDISARIVFSHLPLWPFAQGRETQIIGDAAVARFFQDQQIDLHLSGHHHAFYPGSEGGVAYVSQACLGSGPRALIGESAKSSPGFTLIDISATGNIQVSAFEGRAFDAPVDFTTLPRRISSPDAVLTRLDLAPTQKVSVSGR